MKSLSFTCSVPAIFLLFSLVCMAGCTPPTVILTPNEVKFGPDDTGDKQVAMSLDPKSDCTEWKTEGVPEWLVVEPKDGKGDTSFTLRLSGVATPTINSENTLLISGKDLKANGELKVRWVIPMPAVPEGEVIPEGQMPVGKEPAKPAGFQVFPGARSVVLKWRANAESGLRGYNVYRADSATGSGVLLNSSPVSALRFTDESAAVSQAMQYYHITAAGENDVESPASEVKSGMAGSVKFLGTVTAGKPGQEIHIPVSVGNAAGVSADGLAITLSYDASVVDPASIVVEPTGLAAGLDTGYGASSPGIVTITANDPSFVFKGEGRLFDVRARLRTGLGVVTEHDVYVSAASLRDVQGNVVPVDYTDHGKLVVTNQCYYGDMNSNSLVEKDDAEAMLDIVVGRIAPPTDCHWQAGELNGDTMLDTADGVIILRIAKGMRYVPLANRPSLRDILTQGAPVEISIPQVQAEADGRVAVPVNISSGAGLSAFAATIAYPTDGALVFDDAQLGALTADYPGFRFSAEAGVIRFAGVREEPLSGPGETAGGSIATLYFQVKPGTPSGESTTVELNGVELKGEYADDFAWYTTVAETDGGVVVAEQVETVTPVIGRVGEILFSSSGDAPKQFPVTFVPESPATTWSISGAPAWLSVAPTSGTGSTSADLPVRVSLYAGALPSVETTATLQISAAGGVQSRNVTVRWLPSAIEGEGEGEIPLEGQAVEGQPVEGQPLEGQPAEGQPVEGEAPPIEIGTIEDFQKIGKDVGYPLSGNYILTNDIDASGTATWNTGLGFDPIGTYPGYFTGMLDGQGFVVSNLTINRPGENYVGLFGGIGPTGVVRGLGVEAVAVTGSVAVGGMAGFSYGTTISCFAAGSVSGTQRVGGLIGYNGGDLSGSYASSIVNVSSQIGGGLVGWNDNDVFGTSATITNCCAMGPVTGGQYIGGLVGANGSTGASDAISNCFASGYVSGSVGLGGLVGNASVATVSASYWDSEASNQASSAGSDTAYGKTTSAMKQQVTFVGWDFTSIWAIESFSNGGYPYPRGTVPPVGSEGEAPVTVTVPDVSGLSEAAASAAIAGIGLVVGNVTTQYHPSIPAGEVISQTPAPGGSAILGSVVDLVVSLGPSAGEGEGEGEIPTPGTSAGEVRTYAGMEFAWVPAGTFLMGRNAGEPDSSTNEDPQHEVTLTGGIWLKRTEVTQNEWNVAVGTSPWQSQTYVLEDPNAPAVFVSWDDTQSYISALGTSHPTISFRLPTEAEWEYSYRGGSTAPFYFGDDVSYTLLPGYAWFDANAYNVAQEYAHAVGQRSPNAWSLYDMAGNVYEWCSDRYGAYVAGPATDPTGATTGSNRVLRGGSWIDPAYSCRAAHRLYNSQSTASASIGFRIVIGIP